ncbi:MAG: T9SS type A sorting domain-containing protein [Chitinophagales bacterium]
MKKLYAVLTAMLSLAYGFSQTTCTPNGTPTSTGLLPLTANFPCITQNTSFAQTIFFKNGTNFNVFGQNLIMDTLEFLNFVNLPDSIKAQPNKTPAKYLGGENGCIQVYGNTADTAGQYKLKIYTRLSLRLGTNKIIVEGEIDSLMRAANQGNLFSYFVRVVKNCGMACPDLNDTTLRLFIPYGPPTPGIAVSGDTVFCQGKSVTLTADSGDFRYRWNTGDTTRLIAVAQTGSYSVTTYLNCDSAVSRTQSVQVNAVPNASAQLAPWSTQLNLVVVAQPAGAQYQWLRDSLKGNGYTVVSGAITDTFKTNCIELSFGALSVKVIVSALGCADTSNNVFTVCEGIHDALQDGILTLAPNPASGLVQVNYQGDGMFLSADIYEITGRKVSGVVSRQSFPVAFNVHDLHPGLYLIQVRTTAGTATLHFAKE